MSADGLQDFFGALKGEPWHKMYMLFYVISKMPALAKHTIVRSLKLAGQNRMAEGLANLGQLTVSELWKTQVEIMQWRKEFLDHIVSLKLDAWLAPGVLLPAFRHGTSPDLFPSIQTPLQNILEVPAGGLPITVVRNDEEVYEDTHNDLITKLAKSLMVDSAGMPIGIQVCSLPFQDEIALRVMREIEEDVQFHQKHKPKVLSQIK
jgi:fatty acid amide hydrolase